MTDALRLDVFDERKADDVAAWATSVEEAILWCSHTGYPVPGAVVTAWKEEPGCQRFALNEGTTMIGFGELWVDSEEGEVELAHLIIAPGHRGRGVGAALVTELVARARTLADNVFLRVHPDNDRAQRLYRRLGFERVPATDEQSWNACQPVDYRWMTAPEPQPG